MKKKRMRRRILIALGVFLLIWGAWRLFLWQMASQEQARFEARGYALDLDELAKRYAAPPPEENAAGYYRQALKAIGDMSVLSKTIHRELTEMHRNEDPVEFTPRLQELFAQWRERVKRGQALLDAAEACKDSRWFEHWDHPEIVGLDASFYTLHHTMYQHVRAASVANDAEWLLDAAGTAAAFQGTAAGEPSIDAVSEFFRYRNRTIDTLISSEKADSLPLFYLEALRILAGNAENLLPANEVLAVEAARMHAILKRPKLWQRAGGELFDSTTVTGQLLDNDILEFVWTPLASAMGLGDLARYQFLRFANRILDANEQPSAAREFAIAEIRADLESGRGFLSRLQGYWSLERFARFPVEYRWHSSYIASLEAAVAVSLYHRAEGRLPYTLDELVPEYLGAVPEDPSAPGLPLVYVVEEGYYAVYSRGFNGLDDAAYMFSDEYPIRIFDEMDIGVAVRMPGLLEDADEGGAR